MHGVEGLMREHKRMLRKIESDIRRSEKRRRREAKRLRRELEKTRACQSVPEPPAPRVKRCLAIRCLALVLTLTPAMVLLPV
jgi:hypothetical protein